jgi:hypothetical protein
MPVYVWRGDALVDKATGEAMPRAGHNLPPQRPYYAPDTPPYRSPVNGALIDGRVARREDLKRTGCREVDPTEWHGGFRKEKYARKQWAIEKAKA